MSEPLNAIFPTEVVVESNSAHAPVKVPWQLIINVGSHEAGAAHPDDVQTVQPGRGESEGGGGEGRGVGGESGGGDGGGSDGGGGDCDGGGGDGDGGGGDGDGEGGGGLGGGDGGGSGEGKAGAVPPTPQFVKPLQQLWTVIPWFPPVPDSGRTEQPQPDSSEPQLPFPQSAPGAHSMFRIMSVFLNAIESTERVLEEE